MRSFITLLLISGFMASCGVEMPEYGSTKTVYQIGETLKINFDFDEKDVLNAYQLCSSLRSKRSNFPFRTDESFFFTLREKKCATRGNNDIFIESILTTKSNEGFTLIQVSNSEIMRYIANKENFTMKYYSIIETDITGVFSDVCVMALAGDKIESKNIGNFTLSRSSNGKEMFVEKYTLDNSLKLLKNESYIVNIDEQSLLYGAILSRKEREKCYLGESDYSFEQILFN